MRVGQEDGLLLGGDVPRLHRWSGLCHLLRRAEGQLLCGSQRARDLPQVLEILIQQ